MLFMDESGHDHKNAPYEVRGGIALHASKVWAFTRDIGALEEDCFGDRLHQYKSEIKGAKLLEKRRLKWAEMMPELDALSRRRNCRSFLLKGLRHESPTRIEFAAFGQACLQMVHGIFHLLKKHEGKLFACMVPAGTPKPDHLAIDHYLSKDKVFLLQRYYNFLDTEAQTGLLIMDESDDGEDRKYIRQMDRYFSLTETGQLRAKWIVPAPFFVSSAMACPIQAADVAIYCVNWCWRLDGMAKPVREELADRFGSYLRELQWLGEVQDNGNTYRSYGIVHVPDPYSGRQ